MSDVLLFGAKAMVAVFFVGIVGSLVVVVVTFIEDLELFLGDEEPTDNSGFAINAPQ